MVSGIQDNIHEDFMGSATRLANSENAVHDPIYEEFVKAAWSLVISEENTQWLKQWLKYGEDLRDREFLEKILNAGISEQELARYTKIMEYKMLFEFLYMLDDPTPAIEKTKYKRIGNWALFETDKAHNPKTMIRELYKLLLSFDPSGREMRPPDIFM